MDSLEQMEVQLSNVLRAGVMVSACFLILVIDIHQCGSLIHLNF